MSGIVVIDAGDRCCFCELYLDWEGGHENNYFHLNTYSVNTACVVFHNTPTISTSFFLKEVVAELVVNNK